MRAAAAKSRGSTLEWISLPKSTLGVLKRFGLYLPADYGRSGAPMPVLYLFRGHESEWAGEQDGRPGLLRVLDGAIARGEVEPLVVVLPGFMEPSRKTQGVPVNWTADGRARGVGNGRFEDHFFEIKSWVERNCDVRVGPLATALDGFSMGGYSAVLLATRYPHLFGSAGAYDGSFMWPDQIDPRTGRGDRLWFAEACAPFFRSQGVWDRAKMERCNPLTWIRGARGRRLADLKRVRFHLRCAASEHVGNLDRCLNVVIALAKRGARNSFDATTLVLAPEAAHSWKWADRHLAGTLPLHDEVFAQSR